MRSTKDDGLCALCACSGVVVRGKSGVFAVSGVRAGLFGGLAIVDSSWMVEFSTAARRAFSDHFSETPPYAYA
jgi:hypothetical protein